MKVDDEAVPKTRSEMREVKEMRAQMDEILERVNENSSSRKSSIGAHDGAKTFKSYYRVLGAAVVLGHVGFVLSVELGDPGFLGIAEPLGGAAGLFEAFEGDLVRFFHGNLPPAAPGTAVAPGATVRTPHREYWR